MRRAGGVLATNTVGWPDRDSAATSRNGALMFASHLDRGRERGRVPDHRKPDSDSSLGVRQRSAAYSN